MILIWLILGLLLPTVCGWLLLRLCEWSAPVLFPPERWVMGCLLGVTFTMYISFFANILFGVPFTLWGFFGVQLALACVLGMTLFFARPYFGQTEHYSVPPVSHLSKTSAVVLLILGLWTVLKIGSGLYTLAHNPIYLDDTVDNWNLRGKLYYVDTTYNIHLDLLGGIASYSPAVPLTKTWLATLAGEWREGLVNSIHGVWLLCALALVFFALRRHSSLFFSFIGVYLLASLPLYLLQGTNTYADVYVSAHVFVVVSLVYHAMSASSAAVRSSFLRLAGLACAVLTFTKNEGVALYLPAALLLLALVCALQWKQQRMSARDIVRACLFWAGALLCLTLPWLLFKWMNGLPFGNAKAVTGLSLGWQPGVVTAMTVNTFFEGNWLLLFSLVIVLLVWRFHAAIRSPLVVLTAFLALIMSVQCASFLFTSLSSEALYQTGFARGFTQLMPVMVLFAILLLWNGITHDAPDA
ncbi:MAG: hypothetical protein JWM56_957 [Candidatus Peribacteria bacterium]|nr:hypothetical protein [Candidatus Peribacteria bacterium]